MEFGLSTEQTQLKDALDHYLRERAPLDRVRRFADSNEGRAADLIAGLAELGLAGLLIPERHGGVGREAENVDLVGFELVGERRLGLQQSGAVCLHALP